MPDLRYTLRALGKNPLLVVVIVISLGLGIGANTAIFSLLYQAVLRTLPVKSPEQLVVLTAPADFKGGRNSTNDAGDMEYIFSYPMYRGLQKAKQGVSSVASFRSIGANLAFNGQTVSGTALLVSGNYFPTLGVTPHIGRLLEPDDDVHGAPRQVAVLSHSYWENKLGARENVLNQTLRVNGQPMTIVGIAPRGFTGTTFGNEPEVYVPLATKPQMTPGWDGTNSWTDYWIYVFARLQPGVQQAQAQDALNSLYAGLIEEHLKNTKVFPGFDVERFRKSRLTLQEGKYGQSAPRQSARTPLLILMCATVLVLLIAIANTANLLLARGAQRAKELAIRTALGAQKADIIRQMLAEAMLLSLAGGIVGVLTAFWTVDALTASINSEASSEMLSGGLSWPMLAFAVVLSVVTGLLCGLYPAIEAASNSVAMTLRDQAGQVSASVRSARVRKGLVCAQVMISAVLLVPTGLFLKSLVNLMRVDLGMKTDNVITFGVSPELNGYKPAQIQSLYERAEESLRAIPGVKSVTISMIPLIAGNNWGTDLTVEGYSRDPKADKNARFNVVSAGFFSQFGIPLLAGREFADRDTKAAPKVAVVNETFAKHFFGGQNPLGRHFSNSDSKTLDIEIVGLVKDSHYAGVKQKPPKLFYIPWRQQEGIGGVAFYLRTALPPESIIPQIRSQMRQLDPDLPLENLRTFDEQIRRNIQSDRLVLQLAAAFAFLATLLAMLGLYGVMAYSVTRRSREMGIRMALGASRATVSGMIMREAISILVIGLAVGVPAALALARLTESQLFGVQSFDAGVVACAIAALGTATVLAGYFPARKAARVDPVEALRYE